MKKEILNRLKNINLFLFDLEGVLIKGENDENKLISDVKKVVKELRKKNLYFGIITARSEDHLINELKKIDGCNVISSSLDKVNAAEKLLTKYSLTFPDVLYAGDELIDIPLLQKSGFAVVPKHSKREVKRAAHLIIDTVGSEGIFNKIFSFISKSITK